jgi:hypothetical protein
VQGEEEDEGGMTSDLPLRSCCKPRAAPPQQVPPLFSFQRRTLNPLSPSGALTPRLQRVTVVLVAFGFKHGVPDYIDFIFDVRSVPNPWKLNDFKVMGAAEVKGV